MDGKIKVVYIEWSDAISDIAKDWVTKEEALAWGKNEDWIIKQVGFVVEENREYLLLAGKFNPQEMTENRFNALQKIPKTWIRKRKELTSFLPR